MSADKDRAVRRIKQKRAKDAKRDARRMAAPAEKQPAKSTAQSG